MSKENDGGPAFPVNAANEGGAGAYSPHPGMSLRDHFAGQAMQSLIMAAKDAKSKDDYVAAMTELQALAYQMADLMLKAREQ